MFKTIQPHEFSKNKSLMTAMFKLRKKVFIDDLQWSIDSTNGCEIDHYDDLDCAYLVWCSDDQQRLYGSLRLMPTNGPTLLFDIFHATHGNDQALVDHAIFEGTRMCIDEDAIKEDFPALDAARGMSLLLLALAETALAHGIKRLVSNFEAPLSRIYRRAGLTYDLHGHADGYGRKPVYCASFVVNQQVLDKMREKIGVDLPVLEKTANFRSMVKSASMPTANELVCA